MEPRLVRPCDADVFFRHSFEAGTFRLAQGAHDLGGGTEHEGAFGDLRALCDKRTCADDGLRTNDGPVEEGGLHADEAFVADFTSVDHG